MKEVVWVFGNSASGKETFIKNVIDNPSSNLIQRFGWSGELVAECQESLELIGGELDEQRERILEVVPALLDSAAVALVKWQSVDSQTKRPQRLKEALSHGVRHRIIALRVGDDVLAHRLKTKPLWQNYGHENELIEVEHLVVMRSLKELEAQFDITIVDSSDSGNYAIINDSNQRA